MVQVQCDRRRRHQAGVSQPAVGILFGVFGNTFRSRHGFTDRRLAAVCGARRALTFAKIQRDTEAAILIELQVFQLAFAHADPQALLHAHRHFCLIGALAFCLAENFFNQYGQFLLMLYKLQCFASFKITLCTKNPPNLR